MFKRIAAVAITASTIDLSALPSIAGNISQNCKISRSVYRDANGKGFELVFGQSVPGLASSRATAVIKRVKQGELYRFDVEQGNGYGSIYLSDLKQNQNRQDKSFIINFFNSDFTSGSALMGRETSVPKYAFINGLGSYDYYSRRASLSDTNPPLGDTMWVFNRCQK